MAKVDLITGFLGSGKTTFIKKYARYLMGKGERIGIIENDYGAISVDMMLLHEELGEECGLEMVVAGDMDCYRRRFKTKLISMGMLGYDRVIVEPSGIFDVDYFFDILYEEPLDRWYQIGNVIAITDSVLENDMSEKARYFLASQVAGAGRVVFSKTDLTTEEQIQCTKEQLNRVLEEFQCKRRFQLGKKQTSSLSDDIVVKPWSDWNSNDYEIIADCGYISESHIKKTVSEDNSYKSVFYYNVEMEKWELKELAEELFSKSTLGHIYRFKGFVRTPGEGWLQINCTAEQIQITPIPDAQEVIIVVGENLREEEIGEYIRKYSHTENITSGSTSHRSCH